MRRGFANAGLALAAMAVAGVVPEMTERGLIYPRRSRAPVLPRDVSRAVYHRPGVDTVLMDWDLPKGKRARRRARGQVSIASDHRQIPETKS